MNMIEVMLEAKVQLPDIWGNKKACEELPFDSWIGIFEEDLVSFIEDCGGLEKIVKSVEWKEA